MMQLGIAVPTYQQHARRESILEVALKADELEFDSIWIPDHIVTGGTVLPRLGPVWFEPFVVYSYIAALTTRVRLGLAVLVVPYRHPVFTAKLVSTLDQLSGGRVILGVGSGGDVKVELDSMSISHADRGPMTDEYLRAMKALWAEGFE
ncbi:MAG: LLM class flavin-dependent oxidoreductase, partial [Dehalococcoidia bacterium]